MPELPVKAQLVDRILEGDLRPLIERHRADGASWDTVARHIWVATGYLTDVTGVTVKAWHDAMTDGEVTA